MNTYRFQDIKVGMTESFSYVVSNDYVESFCSISGDTNPLHMDDAFAKEHGYESRVVYGMLTASLFSTFAGCYLPGMYCLIQQVESKFLRPVFIEDILLVSGRISEIHESVRRVRIEMIITNQHGQRVVKGRIDVGFLE